MADLVANMKQAALAAVEASKPVAVMFATVSGIEPLRVNVEQKMTLEETQLIIPAHAAALGVGDVLILLRVQGGQKFVVLGVKL